MGFGRADATIYEPTMAMLGWGLPEQRVTEVGAPLAARAMLLRRGGRRHALVTVDLCFISSALRARVLEELATEGPEVAPADRVLADAVDHLLNPGVGA